MRDDSLVGRDDRRLSVHSMPTNTINSICSNNISIAL